MGGGDVRLLFLRKTHAQREPVAFLVTGPRGLRRDGGDFARRPLAVALPTVDHVIACCHNFVGPRSGVVSVVPTRGSGARGARGAPRHYYRDSLSGAQRPSFFALFLRGTARFVVVFCMLTNESSRAAGRAWQGLAETARGVHRKKRAQIPVPYRFLFTTSMQGFSSVSFESAWA